MVYEGRAIAVFHHINAYEEDGHVVVDVCASEASLHLLVTVFAECRPLVQ